MFRKEIVFLWYYVTCAVSTTVAQYSEDMTFKDKVLIRTWQIPNVEDS